MGQLCTKSSNQLASSNDAPVKLPGRSSGDGASSLAIESKNSRGYRKQHHIPQIDELIGRLTTAQFNKLLVRSNVLGVDLCMWGIVPRCRL